MVIEDKCSFKIKWLHLKIAGLYYKSLNCERDKSSATKNMGDFVIIVHVEHLTGIDL